MQKVLIDTNVIMRLFDTSEPRQTEKSKRLFEAAQSRKVALVIAPPVLFEVAWVLRSALRRSNEDVWNVLEAIINWPGVTVIDKGHVKQAIALGKSKNGGFADSYLAVTAFENEFSVATFDERHFKKLETPLYDLK